ncbi:hypothetical protein MAHJHV47_46550 [Mycobacterium avium subsp. hominissuis]
MTQSRSNAPALGTLNHTALTLEALAAQGLSCSGLVIGALDQRQPPRPVQLADEPQQLLAAAATGASGRG